MVGYPERGGTMADKKIKLFVGGHCPPCEEVKKLVQDGAFVIDGEEGAQVDMIDIETEEGFPYIEKHQLTGIPRALDEQGKQCKIGIDRENNVVVFDCGQSEPESNSQETA
jgi:glutaredoxin